MFYLLCLAGAAKRQKVERPIPGRPKHMLEQMKLTTAMKKEIDQVKQNATEIVQAKLEKMATLMEKQHIGGKFFICWETFSLSLFLCFPVTSHFFFSFCMI